MTATLTPPSGEVPVSKKKKDRTHWLYIAVLVAVGLGIAVGSSVPRGGQGPQAARHRLRRPDQDDDRAGDLLHDRARHRLGPQGLPGGKVGGIALAYFLTMSTLALTVGLLVGNVIHPGEGLRITAEVAGKGAGAVTAEKLTTAEFLLHIIPTTLFSALTTEVVLQTLFVALLVGFALQAMGKSGEPVLKGIGHLQKLVFRIFSMIMWLAPVGAFGASRRWSGSHRGRRPQGRWPSHVRLLHRLRTVRLRRPRARSCRWWPGSTSSSSSRYLAREFLLIVPRRPRSRRCRD